MHLRDPDNDTAWREFIEQYTPRIYGWCRRYELQDSDASDITQEVLSKLVTAMRTFEYNPSRGSFRGWLKTVTNNAVRDFLKSLTRPGRGSGDTEVQISLAAIQDPEALNSLAETIEQAGEQELLREAEARVKSRVKSHTWNAYHLTVVESCKAPDAARQLDMPVSEIYVAKSRVIKMLKQEVEKIEQSPLTPQSHE